MNKKGFTLVELVVVIAIIGVLAAILVPTMMSYIRKAKLKGANSNAKISTFSHARLWWIAPQSLTNPKSLKKPSMTHLTSMATMQAMPFG